MDCVYIVHVGVYVVFAFCVVNHYCGWFVLMIVGFMVLVGGWAMSSVQGLCFFMWDLWSESSVF